MPLVSHIDIKLEVLLSLPLLFSRRSLSSALYFLSMSPYLSNYYELPSYLLFQVNILVKIYYREECREERISVRQTVKHFKHVLQVRQRHSQEFLGAKLLYKSVFLHSITPFQN